MIVILNQIGDIIPNFEGELYNVKLFKDILVCKSPNGIDFSLLHSSVRLKLVDIFDTK